MEVERRSMLGLLAVVSSPVTNVSPAAAQVNTSLPDGVTRRTLQLVDAREWLKLADQFTDDANAVFLGRNYSGKQAIVSRYKAFFSHCGETVSRVDLSEVDTRGARSVVTTQISVVSTRSLSPGPQSPRLVGQCTIRDELIRAIGWKIARRTLSNETYAAFPW